ncbi:hypothetical protein ATW7_09471 [Alteromonadales bacterium TW-7]|nr:hypothetical protein ATW7_09471 [Alteromonadales bacterium TW-7]
MRVAMTPADTPRYVGKRTIN